MTTNTDPYVTDEAHGDNWSLYLGDSCERLAELPDDSADLTATRRLSLAAREQNGLGLLLRHRSSSMPSAATTRWSMNSPTPTRPDRRTTNAGRT